LSKKDIILLLKKKETFPKYQRLEFLKTHTSWVFLSGNYKEKEAIGWATKIAARYMGKKKKAPVYGRTNGGEGAILVRIRPKK
jgi:hypothetical protein